MKKTNNKFRGNGGNKNHSAQVYSLNYKFDSSSIAGKFSDTALNLIKRYNDLARDAISNSDIVSAEMFRQYAEHYRKILTDINEKRSEQKVPAAQPAKQEESAAPNAENNVSEQPENSETEIKKEEKPKLKLVKKELKVVEVDDNAKNTAVEKISKPKKIIKRRVAPIEEQASVA